MFGEGAKQPLREFFSIAAGGNKVQARCGAAQEPGSVACTDNFGMIPPNQLSEWEQPQFQRPQTARATFAKHP